MGAKKITKPEKEWKEQLTPEEFQVTRKKGTETRLYRAIPRLQRTRNLSLYLLRKSALQF